MPIFLPGFTDDFYTDEKLRSCIVYLISKAKELQLPSFNRTKLVKLLFLADYRAKQQLDQTISGVQYEYYAYGPFSPHILDAIDELVGYEIVEQVIDHLPSDPDKGIAYRYSLGDSPRFELTLTDQERDIIDSVLNEFGRFSLQRLLKHVYNTPVMQDARPLSLVLE